MSLGHILDVSLAFPVYLCEAHTCVKYYLKILELLPVKECSLCGKTFRNPSKIFHSSFLKPVFPFQDLISNSLYYLPYNSYEVSSENLVLDQLIIP